MPKTECELLVRRCSDLWRALGFPKHAWWDKKVEHYASNYFGTDFCIAEVMLFMVHYNHFNPP